MFNIRGGSIIFFFEKKVGKIFSSSKWPQKHIHTCRSHTRISIYNILRQIFHFAHFLKMFLFVFLFFLSFFSNVKTSIQGLMFLFYLSKFAKIMNCLTTHFLLEFVQNIIYT